MATILDKRIINLASQHGTKLNGSSTSNVSFFFQNLLRPEKDIAYTEVGIISCEIPVSFYTVNATNNFFEMDLYFISPNVIADTKQIYVPVGNYTATTLIAAIILAVREAFKEQAGFPDYSVPNLVISINSSTGKLSWSFPVNATWSKITFRTLGNRFLKRVYGWLPDDIDITDVPITASFPLNLLGINKINVGSNNLATYNYDSGSQGFSNIIASIEVNAAPYGIILYKNQSLTYNVLRVAELDNFTIELKDSDGNFIDFNGQDFNITLGLNIYRYMPQFSQTSFSDILGIKPPESPEPPKKPEPIIKNDLDLLTYQ